MELKNELEKRNLPRLLSLECGEDVSTVSLFEKRREEIKEILQSEEYGYLPKPPEHMSVTVLEEDGSFARGNATLKSLRLSFSLGGSEFSFPVWSLIPKKAGKHPAFVNISFFPEIPNRYTPAEEITDEGFALFSFCYKDVTSDDGDFESGCAPFLCPDRKSPRAPGKIAIWAWAAMRVMDYVSTLEEIDGENVAVIGHSRLGKTALLAGGFDKRFKYVIPNNSGCSGAALSRGKKGETKAKITEVFPYWFCPQYLEMKTEYELSFDQHFLLALTAPRHLLIGSAEEDLWADPESEFLSLLAASEAWELFGKKGLIHRDEIPRANTVLADGECCYHLREGGHYLSRHDFKVYMSYIKGKLRER